MPLREQPKRLDITSILMLSDVLLVVKGMLNRRTGYPPNPSSVKIHENPTLRFVFLNHKSLSGAWFIRTGQIIPIHLNIFRTSCHNYAHQISLKRVKSILGVTL
jgi:hypothetical protein